MSIDTTPLDEKYAQILNELEQHVRIYDRRDLLMVYDLVYHSVTSFYFQNQLIRKGWLEALVLGDTRTGKTQAVQQLIRFYKAGEIATGESSSFAGLVGGLQQNQKRWSITWGKIPLNNGRLLVIDEVSGLETDDIAAMSGIRSSGVAEITKIQTEKTNAKTRLIWISNPRKAKTLPEYTYGVYAIKELIGRPEDIARFDIFLTTASGEVGLDVYNKQWKGQSDTFSQSACHELVMWAWSRTPQQITILPETEQLILKLAMRQGKKYVSTIPLVEAAEQRIKLAKLACAVAARFFSTDDGTNLIVKPEHAQFGYTFLEFAYAKPSLNYAEWSLREQQQRQLRDTSDLDEHIPDEIIDILLEWDYIRVTDMAQIIEDRSQAKELLKTLTFNRALRRQGTSYYYKTAQFIEYLKQRAQRIKTMDDAEKGHKADDEPDESTTYMDTPF